MTSPSPSQAPRSSRLALAALAAASFAAGALLSPLASVGAKDDEPQLPAKAYFAPGGSIEPALCDAIKSAQREVLIAMYNFTSKELSDAVVKAKARGVDVKVILDKHEAFQKYGKVNDLRKGKVALRLMSLGKTDDDQQIRFHHKFLLIDREVVCTGSFNWTQQADESNWENEVIFGSKRVAADFKEQFDKAWAQAEEDKGQTGPSTPAPRKSAAPSGPGGGG